MFGLGCSTRTARWLGSLTTNALQLSGCSEVAHSKGSSALPPKPLHYVDLDLGKLRVAPGGQEPGVPEFMVAHA